MSLGPSEPMAGSPGQSLEVSLFQCGSCKKQYTRAEHLSRHVRSHTNENPYSCEVCGKSFTRQDLLKRHGATHDPSQDHRTKKRARQVDPNALGRVARACGPCSKSKLKCEEERPCRRCVKKKFNCVSTATPRIEGPNPDDRPMAPSAEPTIGHLPLEELEVPVSSNLPASGIQSIRHELLQTTGADGFGVLEYDGIFFPDFLHDVVIPSSGNEYTADLPGYLSQTYTPRGFMDYGLDGGFDLNDLNFDFLKEANTRHPEKEQGPNDKAPPHETANGVAIGAEAFQKSTLISWTPRQRDHGFAEQANFFLPRDIAESPDLQLNFDNEALKERLSQSARDKILAMVLEGCRDTNIPSVVESFPSIEIFNGLIENFFRWHWPQGHSLIHLPSFVVSEKKPEVLAVIVAVGALRTSMPVFRKLGFALQEAIRVAIPKRFDDDNTQTRDLQLLQAYFLHLDIGLWSGNKRKIEIAESFAQPGVTMLRRARRFHRSSYYTTAPTAEDDNETVERKWLAWIKQESMKRLVYHVFIRDAQTSMSLNVNPLISYTEGNLPLPAARDLWEAESAGQWRDRYLNKGAANRLPSLVEAIQDMSKLTQHQNHIDIQLSGLIVLHGLWALIWEYHQCDSISKGSEHWNQIVLVSRHRELSQLMQTFRLNSSEWFEKPQPQVVMVLELVSMHLHMSLEELELYAGKEDKEAARKVNDSARQWISKPASREAVWHAGKVIQAAKSFPNGLLRDFYAIAVYHASLAFWSFAVVSRVHDKSRAIAPSMAMEASTTNLDLFVPMVWLDDSEVAELQKFVMLRRGEPGIRYLESAVPLSDSVGVMKIVRSIFRDNCAGELLPPLVENLSQLLHDLGQAARVT